MFITLPIVYNRFFQYLGCDVFERCFRLLCKRNDKVESLKPVNVGLNWNVNFFHVHKSSWNVLYEYGFEWTKSRYQLINSVGVAYLPWKMMAMNQRRNQTLHHLYFRWTENPIYVSTDRRSGNGLKWGKGIWSHINIKERLKRLKSLKLLCCCTPYSKLETIESNGSTLSATK